MLRVLFLLLLFVFIVKGCRLIYEKDIDNADLDNKPGELSDCCNHCKCTTGCKGYSWTDYQNGTCWLKSASEPLRDGVQVTFGVVDGYEGTFGTKLHLP
uniref:Apple domain-containing protein n=1 Tax=Panagrolaimus davidi TaxID=227884 RepID=A0A914R094_9BILA